MLYTRTLVKVQIHLDLRFSLSRSRFDQWELTRARRKLYNFGLHSRLFSCHIFLVDHFESKNTLVKIDPSIKSASLNSQGNMVQLIEDCLHRLARRERSKTGNERPSV